MTVLEMLLGYEVKKQLMAAVEEALDALQQAVQPCAPHAVSTMAERKSKLKLWTGKCFKHRPSHEPTCPPKAKRCIIIMPA
jgi:hypothetical protein